MAFKPENQPTQTHPEYDAQLPDWQLASDLLVGSRAVRAADRKYVVPLPGEETDEREARVGRAHFYNAYADTIKALAGIMLRRPPTLEDRAPPQLKEHIEDIDGRGNALAVFAMGMALQGLAKGHFGVLVEYPTVRDPASLDKATERALGLRPYWIMIRPENVVNWDSQRINGREFLTMLVLKERARQRVGMFGHKTVDRYRQFRRFVLADESVRIRLDVWERIERAGGEGGEWMIVQTLFYENLTEIPFVFCYLGVEEGTGCSKPPLQALAEQNLDHYNVLLDHRHAMHIASVPVPFFKMIEAPVGDGPLVMGPTKGLRGNQPDSDARWLETTGASCQQTREELKDIEVRMAQLGVSMLRAETRAAETAEANRIGKADKDSRLALSMRRLKDGLERLFQIHCQYLKIEAPGVTVNLKLDGLSLSPELVDRWLALYEKNAISRDTLWLALAEGGFLPEDFDPKKEADRLAQPDPTILPGDDELPPKKEGEKPEDEGKKPEPGVPPAAE